MSTRNQRWGIGTLILVATAIGLSRCQEATREAEEVASTPVELSRGEGKPPDSQATPHRKQLSAQTAPIATRLNAADGTAQEDVEVLRELISQYFIVQQNRQGRAIGDTRDLVRVLTGDNAFRRQFISSNHPAINARGYLVDRWGTPYHLHQLSSRVIDVRSAGPDRELFTADDVVNDSAHAHQPSDR